jgi:hypothetical protein
MLRHLAMAFLTCTALSGTWLLAAEGPKATPKGAASDRAQVTKFLKERVIGKTVVTAKRTDKWDEGKIEIDYQDQTTFNNLTGTAEGFSFDVTTVSKMTSYDLDMGGKRVGAGRDFSGTFVARYELCERASTKKLTGTARVLSMTIKMPSQEGLMVLVTGLKVGDGKLVWNETVPGYQDMIAAKGKYKPGTADGKFTFSVGEWKLRTEYEVVNYDVDPETLKRTPTKDKLPPFVAREVEQK